MAATSALVLKSMELKTLLIFPVSCLLIFLKRVLRNDRGLGIIRHADAGYDIAKVYAREFDLDLDED